MRWSAKRQTAWERAPDAVWEGYLIDNITPLFSSFKSPLFALFLPLSFTFTNTQTDTLTIMRSVFALSPSSHVTPPTNLTYFLIKISYVVIFHTKYSLVKGLVCIVFGFFAWRHLNITCNIVSLVGASQGSICLPHVSLHAGRNCSTCFQLN